MAHGTVLTPSLLFDGMKHWSLTQTARLTLKKDLDRISLLHVEVSGVLVVLYSLSVKEETSFLSVSRAVCVNDQCFMAH
jgi:hypothetical protein